METKQEIPTFIDHRKYKCKNFTLKPCNYFDTFYLFFHKECIGYIKINKHLYITNMKFEIYNIIDTSHQGTLMMKYSEKNNKWRLSRVVIVNVPMKLLSCKILLFEKCF